MVKEALTVVPVSLAEAASLHDHLTYPLRPMHLTNIFTSIAHDLDFQAVLQMGLTRLNKQITLLEAAEGLPCAVPNGQGNSPFPCKTFVSSKMIRFSGRLVL